MAAAVSMGIDAGSTTCKIVAVDAAGELVGWRIEPAHPLIGQQAERLVAALGGELEIDTTAPLIATGYGRKLIASATRKVTEITCHARGVFRELGHAGTLVDIGGQDTKVIAIGKDGRTLDFAMNDKCAAGTGRFLEVTAGRLQVSLDELGPRAMAATSEESISSTCTVFAESEIISLLAHGAGLDTILRGLHRSLVSRVASLVQNVGLVPPLMLSGGVAKNQAVREILGQALGHDVILPRHPQLMGAYGAALIGLKS